MVRTDPYRWQAPGNGRLFDSSLENWHSSKMSERCIGVLQYLEENPLIEKTDFERELDLLKLRLRELENELEIQKQKNYKIDEEKNHASEQIKSSINNYIKNY